MLPKTAHLGSAIIAAATLMPLAACSGSDASRSSRRVPTYHRDVAPVLAERCGSCHSDSGVAPFSVFDYEEVTRRSSRIARVTTARQMPPWLPAPGYVEYLNDPSLTDEEIDLITRWVEAGTPEGRRPFLFGGRKPPDEWELGEPDLVLEMSGGYVLQPSSTDEYRVFIVPVPISSTQHVRAVDFRPIVDRSEPQRIGPGDSTASAGSPERMPVHHVVMMVDPTRSSRRLDADDPLPGYEGASPMSGARPPEGFFLGWTPGKRPSALPEGLAWRIDPGTDLVVQTHLQPTSRPVEVDARIGLYFADRRPTRLPSSILLSSISIDIPPGDSAYVVEDSYRLPVDVEVLSLYPHAHFLAKEMELFAELPGGARQGLLRIEDWDFNWQDSYRLRDPVHLPAGSVLHMRYSYDNSAGNPDNPHEPPRRTTWGPRSTDEMAELTVQVVTADRTDRDELERSALEKTARTLTEGARFAVERNPEDPRAWFNLGVILHRSGRHEEAISAYRQALALGGDDDTEVHVELGNVLAESGAHADAVAHLRRAIELDPEYPYGHFSLGRALEAADATVEAERHYRRAVELFSDHAGAHAGLGRVLRNLGRAAQAETHFQHALAISPDLVPAHFDLANLLVTLGREVEAIEHYRRTAELEPENAPAHFALGNALRTAGDPGEAVAHLRTAVRLEPGAAEPMLALAWTLATESDPEIRDPAEAVRLAENAVSLLDLPDSRALATLAAAYAASGEFSAATAQGREALDLAGRTGDAALAQSIETHLELYRQRRAYVAPR